MEKKELLVAFFIIFFVIHILFGYVLGSLSPFDYKIEGRFFEVLLIIVVFYFYVKMKSL